ncbi:MAG: glycine zipper 2TM domain-containing protein [Ahniella sp.]|nr:glycine zipper 2TM domain-containing protein [Ahniella sp.]
MKRSTKTILSIALVASFSGLVSAQSSQHRDTARVTRVEQMNHQGNGYHRDPYPRQECWDERSSRYESGYFRDESGRLYRGDSSNKAGRTVIGAIIGGVIGNQVGDGNGRTAATIAGAAIGASVGNKSGRDDRYDRFRDDSGYERRCRMVGGYDNYESDTYRVTYKYAGNSYQTMTNYRPGRNLRVVVDVRPE